MKSLTLVICGALLATLVGASPSGVKNSKVCKGIDIGLLRSNPKAVPFCSSFLGISTSTLTQGTTTTTTTVSVSPDPVTTNIGGTESDYATETDTQTEFATITVTSTSFSYTSCLASSTNLGSNGVLNKRAPANPTPRVTPTQLRGKPSAAISSLCSCIGVDPQITSTTVPASTERDTSTVTTGIPSTSTISSNTVTVTSTSTIFNTVTSTGSTTAGASATAVSTPGPLNYYVYYSSYRFGTGTGVDVTDFKRNNYDLAGAVSDPVDMAPGDSVPDCTFPDGQSYGSCDYFAAVIQGWFLVPETGQYTFTTGGNDQYAVDNFVGFWAGDSAQSDWDNNNADFIAERDTTPYTGGTSVRNFNQGDTIPVTIVYMNGGGPGNFQFQVITPDGTTYSDTTQFWITPCSNSAFVP